MPAAEAVFQVKALAVREPGDGGIHLGHVLRMDHIMPEHRLRGQFGGGEADDGRRLRRVIHAAAGGREDEWRFRPDLPARLALLGKAAGLPVCVLLGGRFGEAVDLYRAISQESSAKMARSVARYRAEGYRKFQLKVGGDPDEDIARIRAVRARLKPGDVLVADANTGWLMHQAARVVRAVAGVDVYIEQPCLSYEECLAIRRRTDHPFVLDETIDSVDVLLRAHAEGAMDVINLKISKVGGLTKARQIRDLCVSLGIAMTIEDSWGGDITTAAIAHLAHSTPEELRFSATDFNSYVTVSTAEGAPKRRNGRMAASTEPGLGVRPRPKVLGRPLVEASARTRR